MLDHMREYIIRADDKREKLEPPQACCAAAIRWAAGEVDKLAAHFVGNKRTDGTRDATVYEQGIGCERAGQMLRELASLMERRAGVNEAGAAAPSHANPQQRCPVCGGNGLVPHGYYSQTTGEWSTTDATPD